MLRLTGSSLPETAVSGDRLSPSIRLWDSESRALGNALTLNPYANYSGVSRGFEENEEILNAALTGYLTEIELPFSFSGVSIPGYNLVESVFSIELDSFWQEGQKLSLFSNAELTGTLSVNLTISAILPPPSDRIFTLTVPNFAVSAIVVEGLTFVSGTGPGTFSQSGDTITINGNAPYLIETARPVSLTGSYTVTLPETTGAIAVYDTVGTVADEISIAGTTLKRNSRTGINSFVSRNGRTVAVMPKRSRGLLSTVRAKIQTRTRRGVSNILRNPFSYIDLPIPIYAGSVDWSINFEDFPSASISYEAIAPQDIQLFKDTYKVNQTEVKINGIDFVVDSFAYDREFFLYGVEETPVNLYKVSISLKSKYSDRINNPIKISKIVPPGTRKVSVNQIAATVNVPFTGMGFDVYLPPDFDINTTISLSDVVNEYIRPLGLIADYTHGIELVSLADVRQQWNFEVGQIIQDGQNTLSVFPAYNQASLTVAPTEDKDNPLNDKEKAPEFELAEPCIEYVVEEDENPEKPPEGSLVLKDLSSNFDQSGPKKTRTKTKIVDGNTEEEETWIYGFAYLAEQIAVDGVLISIEPEKYWRVIEYQKTSHIYKKIEKITLNAVAKDPYYSKNQETDEDAIAEEEADSFGKANVNLVVHPDYKKYVEVDIFGDTITFQTSAEYLVEVKTEGWKLSRFEREDLSRGEYSSIDLAPDLGLDPIADAYYNLIKFRKIPSIQRTAYLLKSKRKDFKKEVGNPFSIEWVSYTDLPDKFKKEVDRNRNLTKDGRVGIITPDLEFVEPFYVKTESRVNSSFAWTPHPEFDPAAPEPQFAPLVTGEESYYRVDRELLYTQCEKKKDKDKSNDKKKKKTPTRYREKTSEFSSQNSGFSDVGETVRLKEVIGIPPDASTRTRKWEDKSEDPEKRNSLLDTADAKIKRYILTSSKADSRTPLGGDLSYSRAKNIEEALLAARTELRIQGMQASQESRSLSWFLPKFKIGDVVRSQEDLFANEGDWRIMSASWSLKFDGKNNRFGLDPLCTIEGDGTQLTLGLDVNQAINVDKEFAGSEDDENSGQKEPKIETEVEGDTETLGFVVCPKPNRRRF